MLVILLSVVWSWGTFMFQLDFLVSAVFFRGLNLLEGLREALPSASSPEFLAPEVWRQHLKTVVFGRSPRLPGECRGPCFLH